MKRRDFLAALPALSAAAPIVDTHIHLFDPRRPQGVPWPDKSNPVLYRPALPDRLRALAAPLGVTGAIEVECSDWLEDNQWVLDIAQSDSFILGMVGNLDPGAPEFGARLERFRRNRLFLGIRFGNLWGRDLAVEVAKPQFAAGLKQLAAAGLSLDTANPNARLLLAVVRASDQAPALRIVIDHLPRMDDADWKASQSALAELRRRPQIYAKYSGVLRNVDGRVPAPLSFYRPRLDALWEIFGEDRLVFGSDWPNADLWGPYDAAFRVVRDYLATKSPAAAEKVWWKNSQAAYRWVTR
jgi:predicted TIM-barrel fold metal-dependent hydrolase